jgi:hypothetical protein
MIHYIKLREKDKKRWAFLTSKGGLTYLTIHASRFETKEAAERLIAENAADNPEWEWKVVTP